MRFCYGFGCYRRNSLGLGEVIDKTFQVEYTLQDEALGKITLTRAMNQIELGKLLLKDGVTLCSVDKQKKQGFKPSNKSNVRTSKFL